MLIQTDVKQSLVFKIRASGDRFRSMADLLPSSKPVEIAARIILQRRTQMKIAMAVMVLPYISYYYPIISSVALRSRLFSGASQCPPGRKTDNPQGRCCVFPFTYGGKSYSACTTYGHNRLWCSLDAVYKGQWANCGEKGT